MTLSNSLSYTGTFLKVNGAVLLIPAVVAYIYSENQVPFLIAGILSFLVGALLSRKPRVELTFMDAMLLSAVTLVLVSLFGAIPFYLTLDGNILEILVDGFFESVSGYTTTGLSVMHEDLPKSMLFLRALVQWIGGLGIIILALSALAYGTSTLYLYREEQESNRILPSVKKSARTVIKIYIFYSFVATVLLWLSGVDLYIAVTDAFTSLSTGGFSSGYVYRDTISEVLMIIFMLVGSVSFTVHYDLFSGDIKKIAKNIELGALFFILLLASMIFTMILINEGYALGDSVHNSVFNVVSALTTTGYNSIDFAGLSDIGKFFISVLMIVGGGMGSTAGGLKIMRVIVLFAGVFWLIKKMSLSEHAILPLKIGGTVYPIKELNTISLYFFMYVAILALSTFVLSVYGYATIDSFFVSASAIGTVGLSTINLAVLPILPKLLLTLSMLFGRLEIIPIIVLFSAILKRLR